MSGKRDYYEVLGVSRNAGPDEIKQAYRNLARRHHPDVAENKTEAEHHFKEINEAFTILSNAEKRAQYDRFGHAAFNPAAGAGGFDFGFAATGFDFFDDVLSSFFGEGRTSRGQSAQSSRGNDIRADVEITLEEAFIGVRREVTVKGTVPCKECHGSGAKDGDVETCRHCNGLGQIREVQQSFLGRMIRQVLCPQCGGQGKIFRNPCKACAGSGIQKSQRKITVSIPAGVDNDNRIRVRNEGDAGPRGGASGDLYVFIHVKPHAHFKREDNHILYNLSASFPEAALGNEVEAPTLAGPEKIQIPAGTQSGDIIRLKGKGMPDLNRHTFGDQFIIVTVKTPKKLNAKQKEILLELARESGVRLNQDKGLLGRMKDAF